MEVVVNHTAYEIPFDLSQITLGKFIEYQDQYGRDLDTQLSELLAKQYDGDADEKELNRFIDIDNHMDNEALAWFSFWCGHNLYEIKTHPSITPILESFRVLRFLLKESMEQVYDLPMSINWHGDEWVISDFKISPACEMDFNEIITSKEAMRQVYKVGKGKWDALPYLCAVYFRKKDEKFIDEFIQEDSDRMKLINELPLLHALQVAFFLSICVSIWSKTLAVSKKEEAIINPR